MKTAIYIENGLVQLVLTPENEWEKSALRSFEGGVPKATIHHGSFYDCRGGWTRHSEGTNDRSLILRVEQDVPAHPTGEPHV